jgi:hypothetical protein
MNNITRRSLISGAAAGLTSLGLFGGAPRAADSQLVWRASEWNLNEFQKLVNDPARIKQMFDIVQVGDGKFLNNIKNSRARPELFLAHPLTASRGGLGERRFDLGHFLIGEAQVAGAHHSFGLTCIAGTDDRSGDGGMV